ncbi:unnamed protein product, partial [Prorocentrum cordatum]
MSAIVFATLLMPWGISRRALACARDGAPSKRLVRQYGDGADPNQLRAIFTAEEVKLLHNQFRTARKDNDRVSTAFEEADKLGVREGKNKAKLGY